MGAGRRAVGWRLLSPPGRLDRRLRAGRARVERLPRPWGPADGSAQSRPVQRRRRLPLPCRPLRLRRGARNDQALLRAPRHGRDPRTCDDPPRPGRHEAGHDPGSRLVPGRRARLMAGDPVSWLLIEPGWDVVARDGTEIGKVEEIVGDTGKDIFNGLSIATGLLAKPKYVPSERVRAITEGRTELDLSAEEVEALDEHDPQPPSEQFRAD